ncbi:MAG: helix-turn-helix transcriptional regulator [Myxococcales bacterium]|nr:helix-turn-helix transcriptional regulator [Myxococcales bacterium]
MGRGGRFDAIAVVEAAYRVDRTIEGWVQAIASASAPSLDRGFGTQAVLYGLDVPDRLTVVALGVEGVGADVEAFLRSAVPIQSSEWLRLLAQNQGRLRTFSELMAGDAALAPTDLYHADRRYVPFRGRRAPFVDHVAFMTPRSGSQVLAIGGMSPQQITSSRAERHLWRRVGVHLAAALRLRRASETSAPVDAVLSPDGRCLHAERGARPRSVREAIREHLRRIEQARGARRHEPNEALDLWKGLAAGRWSLVDHWEADGRRLVLARYNPPPSFDPRRLSAREAQVAELVARGDSNKHVAYLLGVSESTVASHLARALRKFGLRRREELAVLGRFVTFSQLSWAGETLVVQACELAASGWALRGLSEGERAVALLAAAGKSDRQIASLRGTSPRTVANQLRSGFEKLGVRSRGELAALVARDGAPKVAAG